MTCNMPVPESARTEVIDAAGPPSSLCFAAAAAAAFDAPPTFFGLAFFSLYRFLIYTAYHTAVSRHVLSVQKAKGARTILAYTRPQALHSVRGPEVQRAGHQNEE